MAGATARKFAEEGDWSRLAWHLQPNDVVIFNFGRVYLCIPLLQQLTPAYRALDEGDPAHDSYFLGTSYTNEDIEATLQVGESKVHTYE